MALRKSMQLDLTYIRSPLALRQTVAHAFGISLGREFTWDILQDLICDVPSTELPMRIVIAGWPTMTSRMRDEEKQMGRFLDAFRERHPDIQFGFIIND